MISKIMFIAIMCALAVIFIEVRKNSTRLNELEDEQKRHNNIQKVILEQVDQISAHVGA